MKIAESVDELSERPEDFGFCDFETFRKNKEKWIGRDDDELAAIDKGDPLLGCKQVYYIEDDSNYRVDSLEQAERLAREMGLNIFKDFAVKPQIKPVGHNGKFYNEVTFKSKRSLERRKQWA